MSLKLGNKNIAGTQILYSTTGNNTDGAMTQAVTTAQLILKANDTDVVHKTGSETITGTKTFNSEIYSTTDNTLNRTTTQGDASVRMFDYNSAVYTRLRSINNNASTPKETYLDVIARQDGTTSIDIISNTVNIVGSGDNAKLLFTNDYTIYNGFYLDRNDANALKLYNPTQGATAWGSVTAMTAQTLNSNGFIKFNHGLIIQWGKSTSSGTRTITFPKAFTTVNYTIVGISHGGSYVSVDTSTKTTTSVSLGNSVGLDWLAIGY